MRVLFCMGEKSADGRVFVRPSVRCIAIEGDRVAMVHSLQYDYYTNSRAAASSRRKPESRRWCGKRRRKRVCW